MGTSTAAARRTATSASLWSVCHVASVLLSRLWVNLTQLAVRMQEGSTLLVALNLLRLLLEAPHSSDSISGFKQSWLKECCDQQ